MVGRSGNLAVECRSGRALWSSHTSGSPGARLALQSDGNVVLRARSHRALFATGSVSYSYPADPTATTLDRDLGLLPRATLRRGGSRLVMRPNGNLALYRHGTAVWSTKTVGHPGAYAHMRKDGRLVVSDPHGKTLWSSRTHGKLAKLALRSDGTLEIAGHTRQTVWTPKRQS